MKIRARYSLISTILNLIYEIGLLIMLLFSFTSLGVTSEIFVQADQMLDNSLAEEAGPYAGYEVFGGLGLGALGGIAYAFVIMMIMALVVFAIAFLPTIIVGFVSRYKYKKNKPIKFTADAIVKLVIDGLFVLIGMSTLHQHWYLFVVIGTVPIAVVVFSILCLCTKTEGIPDNNSYIP